MRKPELSFKVSMTPKSTNQPPIEEAAPRFDIDDLTQVGLYHASHAAKIVAALYVGHKVTNTLSEIALIAARAHFK